MTPVPTKPAEEEEEPPPPPPEKFAFKPTLPAAARSERPAAAAAAAFEVAEAAEAGAEGRSRSPRRLWLAIIWSAIRLATSAGDLSLRSGPPAATAAFTAGKTRRATVLIDTREGV